MEMDALDFLQVVLEGTAGKPLGCVFLPSALRSSTTVRQVRQRMVDQGVENLPKEYRFLLPQDVEDGDHSGNTASMVPLSKQQEREVCASSLGNRLILRKSVSPKSRRVQAKKKKANKRRKLWPFLLVILMSVFLFTQLSQHEIKADADQSFVDGEASEIEDEDSNQWTRPLFALMRLIVNTVKECVLDYFQTFRYCWFNTGQWLVAMISGYFELLELLIVKMLTWPVTLVLVVAVYICLYWVYKIIAILVPGRNSCPAACPAHKQPQQQQPEELKEVV